MKNISHQKLNLPRFAPLMVLPEAILFPAAMLPLYIFELRYRAMLAWTLEQHRMFCVAPMKPGVTEASSVEDFHHIVGLGLVRACRGHEDGTSHLVLQGIARVRLTSFIQEAPFRIAEIRELPSKPVEAGDVAESMAKLKAFCAQLQPEGMILQAGADQQLAKIHDPELFSDIVAQIYLRDPERRQEVFEELHAGERIRLLLKYLESESEAAD